MSEISDARDFAIKAHGDQLYGNQPYVVHLFAVAQVARDFGATQAQWKAAFLHDVLEDTAVTSDEILGLFGPEVLAIVDACTGGGDDRAEHSAGIYRKIAAYPAAAFVKLADRIANVEAATYGDRHWHRYRAELDGFRAAIRPHVPEAMWDRLEHGFDPPQIQPSRPLGRSGIAVSAVAWGMWRFGGEITPARALIETALEAGVTLFDTADIYGADTPAGFGSAEALLGRVLAEAPGLREHMVIATKGGIVPGVPYDSSAAYLARAIDASLSRLGVEQVALWQVHRSDILTHPAEVARVLEEAHRAGKIGAVGVSNHTAAQAAALMAHLAIPLVSHQPEFSPLTLDPLTDGLFDQAMAQDMAILAWSPLAGGRLADPRDERARAVAALLDRKAEEAGVSRAVAALSWIMAHPARPIPIAGTQNPARIAELKDVHTPRWTRAEWYAVLVASRGERLP